MTATMLRIPPPVGTVLTEAGRLAVERAVRQGADAILLEPVTLPGGAVLPADTPMRLTDRGCEVAR